MRPLEGLFVLDFSTLLPGPLATLLLAEAGAEVVKVEPPGRGEEMRAAFAEMGTRQREFRTAQSRQEEHRARPEECRPIGRGSRPWSNART